MTLQEAYTGLKSAVEPLYGAPEATAIAGYVIEQLTGFSNSQRLLHKHDALPLPLEEKWQQILVQLQKAKPLQYIFNEAYFFKMKLYVDEHVLIPRPETEELVEWILKDLSATRNATVLDVGTGSGCIPIALKKGMQTATVFAIDISREALAVAQKNATAQATEINFSCIDILDEKQWKELPQFDCIVSNPPYIAHSEAGSMNDNVLQYEPHLALFVPNENPLLFYDRISTFGQQHLNSTGKLFFEINEAFGSEVQQLLQEKGYKNIVLKKDLPGKDRMIAAEKE